MQHFKADNCVNMRMLPFKGGLTMLTMPKDMPNPFTTKVLEAVLQALAEDKPSPSLREEEFTSFLFPADSEAWTDVALTFSVGRRAGLLLLANESLPKFPDSLIAKEF